jgi:guanylate kinase
MLVLSSPSGAGKSTIARLLLELDKELDLSISVTTRPRRPSEVDGVHYHFIDPERFAAMRDRGELLEWAEVHGNLYATPRRPVEEALARGRDMLFDIDWQGTQQIAKAMPDDVARVFLLPPSMEELRARLERRAEDRADVIARRLANARAEIGHWREYDYVIVNEDLQRTLSAVRAILAAERLRRTRQESLASFVEGLLAAGPSA